jgi:hypothetical protein
MAKPPDINNDDAARENAKADPAFRTTESNVGAQGITLLAVAVIVIVTLVLYGLNGPNSGATPETSPTSSPTAAGNSGSGALPAPQSGSHNPS